METGIKNNNSKGLGGCSSVKPSALWALPDFIDPGQWMHHHHPLFGNRHDMRSQDELTKTLKELNVHVSALL